MAEEWREYLIRQPIKALRWSGMHEVEGVEGVGCVFCYPRACLNYPHKEFHPNYHHGLIEVYGETREIYPGDYLVEGHNGVLFPYPGEEFHLVYEISRVGGD